MNMRVTNKKLVVPISAIFLCLLFLLIAPKAHAQVFGGGSSSSLYSSSSSTIFQNPSSSQQGSSGTQTTSSANILNATTTGTLAVTGAPAAATTTADDIGKMDESSEIMILSAFAALFAIGILALLWRQIRHAY